MGHSPMPRSPIIHYYSRQKFDWSVLLQIRTLLLSQVIQAFCSTRITFINILLLFPV